MHYVKRRKDELLILKSDTLNVEEFPGNVNFSKLLISCSTVLIDIFAQCRLLILPYICHFAKCEARYFLRLQLQFVSYWQNVKIHCCSKNHLAFVFWYRCSKQLQIRLQKHDGNKKKGNLLA